MTERGLVISSSGVRLVEEIGNLHAIIAHSPDPERYAWKHVYGTSGGALVATFLCQYPVGQEQKAINDFNGIVERFLGENGARSFFPFGILQGLTYHKSLYDSAFLREIVDKHINPEAIRTSGRHLYIVAVNYANAEPTLYTEKDWKIMRDAVIASCSIPLVYPPKDVFDDSSPTRISYYGDGGITDFVPIERALLNPKIGDLDVIISVGERHLRSLNFAKVGNYPDLSQIINTLVESFYRSGADNAEDLIKQTNAIVKIKKCLAKDPYFLDDLPMEEAKRLTEAANNLERDTYIKCTIFKPTSPIRLGAVGIEEKISRELWQIGYASGKSILQKDGEIEREIVID